MLSSLMSYLIALPAIVIGLTFHEYAHGRMAYYLGDKTAYYAGRLTLNPLAHLDPMGFLMLIFFHFGWAKPVPINPNNIMKTSRQKGIILISIAGPLMNLLLAIIGMFLLCLLNKAVGMINTESFLNTAQILVQLIQPLVTINLMLLVFNLIPVPPLDGSKVLEMLLPYSSRDLIMKLEMYGPMILLVLIVFNVTGKIITPAVSFLYTLLFNIFF